MCMRMRMHMCMSCCSLADSPRVSSVSTHVPCLQPVLLRLTYFGVHLNQPGKPKLYLAQLKHGGKMVYLGSFATAEVAALCIARTCHRAVARGAGGGKASGVGGATTERGGEQGHGPAYAARRSRQGGGHAIRC